MTNQGIKDQARSNVRNALAASPSFLSLSLADQKAMYTDLYKQQVNQLSSQLNTINNPQNATVRAFVGENAKKASDLIDDDRHQNQRIEQAGELAGEFVDEVDFPGFVADLLKAVFDANLKVTLEQMEAFQKLLKSATQDLAKFIRSIDNAAAFAYLAENNSDEFNIDFSDSEQDQDGNPAPVLTNSEGEPVDIGDNEVKARIMDAKIQMAKEHRALLRETILMGVTRLVVEKGVVKASVLFDIKAGERINKADKAALKDSLSRSTSGSFSGGIIGSIFGGPRGGKTTSRRKTQISVSSAKSQASTDLAAKLAGSVDITFKSDYFKLDNFAKMYGPVTETDRAEAEKGAAQPAS